MKSGTDVDENLTFDAGNEAESCYFLGEAGIDTITGGTADDWLYGQAGNDTFIGGGADTLTADDDADKFVLDKASGASDTDIIKDFSKVGSDKIQIDTTD